MKCNFCKSKTELIVSFGKMPLANSYKKKKDNSSDIHPLSLIICKSCFLVQLQDRPSKKVMFDNYLWITNSSSFIKDYVSKFYKFATKNIIKKGSVLEIASNDGYFLKYFSKKKWKCYGIEPAKNLKGFYKSTKINLYSEYFEQSKIAMFRGEYDLIFARNVIAHTDNLNNFLQSLSLIMNSKTITIIEFHSLYFFLKKLQYDSVYHEHNFYLSLSFFKKNLNRFGLYAFDVLPGKIGGGSLAIAISKKKIKASKRLDNYFQKENELKITNMKSWQKYSKDVLLHKKNLNSLIEKLYYQNYSICAYGASARGNTLLKYTKIESFIDLVIDNNILKNGKYYSGTNLKIHKLSRKLIKKYDVIILLAWNFKLEILKYLKKINYTGIIVVPFPKLTKIVLK